MQQTQRLDIVPARMEALVAEYRGRDALARALGVRVPISWPPKQYGEDAVTETFDRLKDHPGEADWWWHYLIEREEGVLVGAGGYKGPPNAEGVVRVNCSILQEFRRHGYATEAMLGLIEHAFDVALVKKVIAFSVPDVRASMGLLEKCGFSVDPEQTNEELIRYAISRERRPLLPVGFPRRGV